MRASWWLVAVCGLATAGCEGGSGKPVPPILWGPMQQPDIFSVACTNGIARLEMPDRDIVSLAGTVAMGTAATSNDAAKLLGTNSGPVVISFADGLVVARCQIPDLGAASQVTFLVPATF